MLAIRLAIICFISFSVILSEAKNLMNFFDMSHSVLVIFLKIHILG